jgi:hypothetical protein
MVLLTLAACERLPRPARDIADLIEASPPGIQPGDSSRFYLDLDRRSLQVTEQGRSGDTTLFAVQGRWRAASERLAGVDRAQLEASFRLTGIHPDSVRTAGDAVDLWGTVLMVGDSSGWRMTRDLPTWTASGTGSRQIPLRLDRWHRHIVDNDRPGKAVFVIPADIDHDGRPEILAGAFSYSRIGAGDDRWIRTRLPGELGNVALAADLDRDGYLDLIGTKSAADYPVDSSLVWLRGSADGRLAPGTPLPHGHGDFLQGIAVAESSATGARVALSWHKGRNGVQLLSLRNGQPDSLVVISTISQDEQLTAADLDRDGLIDLVTGTMWLHRTTTGWVLEVIDTTQAAPDRNRVGDINGDGLPDVVTGFEAISVPGPLVWYAQTPDHAWVRHDIASVTGPMSLDLGDLDGDGDIDVVVGEHNLKEPRQARLLIFENLGHGAAWRQVVVATGDEHHDGAQLADIDGDGDPDIISVGWGHSKVLLYENLAIP